MNGKTLVNSAVAGMILGVTRQRVVQLRADDPNFPVPSFIINEGAPASHRPHPVWTVGQIITYRERRNAK